MSSSQAMPEEAPPALPPRSTQRDSRGSPVQPTHPVTAEASPLQAQAQIPPQVPDKTAAQPAQQVQSLLPAAAPVETVKTKRQELSGGDAHWEWKVGFRAASIIVGLIGIGCAAWIVANFTDSSDVYSSYYAYFDDEWTLPWTLITFCVSVLWSAICIIVFFRRLHNAPVHPGAQVGVDLVLWLGLLTTGIFALFGTVSVGQWGEDGRLGYSGSGSGYYTMSDNGTWVWDSSQYSSYYGEDRSCNSSQSYRYNSRFASCEEQDAFLNAIWQTKTLRYNVDLTATVCQFLMMLIHFILFVWACVDTHRRNSRSVPKDAEKLAADIVMNMIKSGAIIPAPGQAHFQPMPMGHQGAPMGSFYPQQQQYPQQQFQPYPQPYPGQYPTSIAPGTAPVPQNPVASSSNEKGAGSRYA
ncbi:hypothetical protein BU23DRAFT_560622 [Bimuria novae-zelandiae CBS 107.79]|uniref:Uncharacterized protein n=1 Tax=Bimuria novae-zelandiae CBS 107.79 TaxID=1447943 RepID=A0A6A5UNG4_9PLEO|nr:hypothetical protein BU23DRAFT_560622 [Bimuria novae-zelandiae CBS 107.79]